jgi:hypothetical protein
MPSQIVSYKLESDGSIPSFIKNGGFYPSADTWQEMVLMGITFADATIPSDVPIYSTEAEIVAYLSTYTSGLRAMNPLTQEDLGLWSQADAASRLMTEIGDTA